MPTLAFDLGGTHLRGAIVDDAGRLSHRMKLRLAATVDSSDPARIWSEIRGRMRDYLREHDHHLSTGDPLAVSFPGPISKAGRALSAPTLVGASQEIPDLRLELAKLSSRPVYLLNDLSAAAWFLASVRTGRFMVITVSSGIGSKIFDPAVGCFDENPFGGEIGHGVVDESDAAPRCDCGGKGHLGAIASGRGIERMGRTAALEEPAAFARSACVTRWGATAATLTNEEHLVPALLAGDPWAVEIVTRCSRYLARIIVSTTLAAGLDSITVIGGFALAGGAVYLKILQNLAAELCDYALLGDSIAARITLSAVDEETCLAGAGLYARSRHS